MIALSTPYLRRYKDIAWLLYKYGGSDLVQRSGLNDFVAEPAHSPRSERPSANGPSTNGDAASAPSQKPLPEQLADDLESLGPAFVKLGQLLSTRPDILPRTPVQFPAMYGYQTVHSSRSTEAMTVVDVNTMRYRGKERRMGRGYAKLHNWKKAVITLKAGDEIQFFDSEG